MGNEMTSSGRLIAIGDIHGHSLALKRIVEVIQPTEQDTVVTLGDYVNRGPDSRGVIDILIELQQRCHLVPILGNHEEMMLDGRSDIHAENRWRHDGGDATLASYGDDLSIANIPEAHWEFLEACRPSYETDDFIFVHANYAWYSEIDRQSSADLRWISIEESEPKAHMSGKTVILGHSPGPVRDLGFCRCIDTGCGFGGMLTAMDVLRKTFWQVREEGELVPSLPKQGYGLGAS
jgi:serine/threonine protein phosphatase 1